MIDRDPIHGWFELTYSSYLVLPRSLLQSMPQEWQAKLVTLLEDLEQSFDTSEFVSEYQVTARRGGKYVEDPLRHYERGRRRIPLARTLVDPEAP